MYRPAFSNRLPQKIIFLRFRVWRTDLSPTTYLSEHIVLIIRDSVAQEIILSGEYVSAKSVRKSEIAFVLAVINV